MVTFGVVPKNLERCLIRSIKREYRVTLSVRDVGGTVALYSDVPPDAVTSAQVSAYIAGYADGIERASKEEIC
jgi:hypothetical protein